MFGIGGWEMLLIAVVALLVFGPKRLPELAKTMGRGLAEFRRASSDLRRSFDLDLDPTRTPAPPPETQPPAQAGDPAILPPSGHEDLADPDPSAEAASSASADSSASASASEPRVSEAAAPGEDPDRVG